jgi:TRAF-interacting protein
MPMTAAAAAARLVCTICYEDLRSLSPPVAKSSMPSDLLSSPTHLFFQSTGACPTQARPSSQEADPKELPVEVVQLEQKAASLGRVVEEHRDGTNSVSGDFSCMKSKL